MFALAGDELREFDFQPVRAVNTAMTPPKERVQNVFPWGGGVFQNEMKLLQMMEGDRLGDFSKLLPVLLLLFILAPTLPSGSRNLSAVVL